DDWSDTVRGVGFNMFETIRQNPIPAALAGFGLAWLFARAQNQRRYDYRFDRRWDREDFRDLADYGSPYDELPMSGRHFPDTSYRAADDLGRRAREFSQE